MQASVGASLKAMMDRFVGSLGGALWSVGVLLALQHFNRFSTGTVLVVALVPLAILAAFKPGCRTVPTTAIILLLSPSSVAGPLASATQRMFGIGLGTVVALVVVTGASATPQHKMVLYEIAEPFPLPKLFMPPILRLIEFLQSMER